MASKSKTKPITPANMRALAIELIDYFNEQGYWFDMGIYVDGERWSSNPVKPSVDPEEKKTEKGTVYYVEKDINVEEYLEYCNPNTVTLYFEGPLYHAINYHDINLSFKLDKKFLNEYGLYFEQGYAWSMAAYEV